MEPSGKYNDSFKNNKYMQKMCGDGSIYFEDTITGEKFHVGDRVRLDEKVTFYNGGSKSAKREFIIAFFSVAEYGHKPLDKNFNNKEFEFVYAFFTDGEEVHLNNIYPASRKVEVNSVHKLLKLENIL